MALPGAFQLFLDYDQRRVKRDRVAVTALGREWDHWVYEDTFIDPVTDTLMLQPSSTYPLYHASNSGIFAKLAKADYTLTTGSNWVEEAGQSPADGPYLVNKDGVNEPVQVTDPIKRNRGFCLSIFSYNAGVSGNGTIIEFGVNATAEEGREFRLYRDGTLEYWLNDVFQKVIKLQLPTNRQYIDLTVIPMRKREILFLTSRTTGAVLVLDDILETDTDPEIWSATDKLYWNVPEGKAKVQAHILKFPTTGFATTLNVQLGRAPETGATLEDWTNDAPALGVTNARVLGDPAYAGTTAVSAIAVMELDGVTGFVPNDVSRDCRLKATLTGDGEYTPFMYGVHLAYESEIDLTADEDTDVTEHALPGVRLEVSDDCGGVRLTYTLRGDAAGDVPGLAHGENRPAGLSTSEGLVLFDGVTMTPKWTDAIIEELQRYEIECRDRWRLLERYTFRDRVVLDGLPLSHPSDPSCIGKVLEWAGLDLTTETDLDDVDFTIPEIPHGSCTDGANFVIEVGETAASVIDRLVSDFAAGFLYGFKPTADVYKFWFKDPEALSDTPVLTLYRTPEAAILDGVDPEDAVDLTYWDHTEQPMPVEANEVWVTGYDPRAKIPIQSVYRDDAAQDPTTAVASRPENWSGDQLPMGVIEPRITSQAAGDRCCSQLAPMVTARRYGGEWRCNCLPNLTASSLPLWRWDVVRLKEAGPDGVDLDYRISSLWCNALLEIAESAPLADDAKIDREVGYTGVRIGTGHPRLGGGRTLAQQREQANMRRLPENRFTLRPGWEAIAQGRPVSVVAIP